MKSDIIMFVQHYQNMHFYCLDEISFQFNVLVSQAESWYYNLHVVT